MNQMDNPSTCERADDLISVLYGEATEHERRDFELHLKECGSCRAEFASFAQVRKSVGEWRDEALTGFVSSPVTTTPVRKSAVAALRQFFDLSPLWLKGAAAFAAVAFCVLAVLAVVRLQAEKRVPVVAANPGAVYTEQDVNRVVAEALAKQENAQKIEKNAGEEKQPAVVAPAPVRNPGMAKAASLPKSRRPFSRAEREQLAAELRLLATGEDELNLIGDRINR